MAKRSELFASIETRDMRLLIVPASAAAVLVAIVVAIPTAQQQPAGAYTQRQAEAGRTAYEVSCAGCHGPDLTGSSDAPALTGPNFSGAWGGRPVNELFRHIMETMPPQAPGSLGEEMTLNVLAYIIQRKGGGAGSQDLTIKTATTVNAAASSRGSGPGLDGAWRRHRKRTRSRRRQLPCAASPSGAK